MLASSFSMFKLVWEVQLSIYTKEISLLLLEIAYILLWEVLNEVINSVIPWHPHVIMCYVSNVRVIVIIRTNFTWLFINSYIFSYKIEISTFFFLDARFSMLAANVSSTWRPTHRPFAIFCDNILQKYIFWTLKT